MEPGRKPVIAHERRHLRAGEAECVGFDRGRLASPAEALGREGQRGAGAADHVKAGRSLTAEAGQQPRRRALRRQFMDVVEHEHEVIVEPLVERLTQELHHQSAWVLSAPDTPIGRSASIDSARRRVWVSAASRRSRSSSAHHEAALRADHEASNVVFP